MTSSVILLKSSASDLDVANAARVSFNKHTDTMREEDKGLIKFLLRNGHTSPFRHTYFQFLVDCPIFVAREFMRHNAGWSYNEVSGRYSELEKKFYVPFSFREQIGKPGEYEYVDRPEHWPGENGVLKSMMSDVYEQAWGVYIYMLEYGIAKEQARAVLPVGIHTKFYASCNALSLMNFLELRCDQTAQEEIRLLAGDMATLFAQAMPVTYEAWVEYSKYSPE